MSHAYRVRPCSAAEDAIGSSRDVAQLLAKGESDITASFAWCEAVDASSFQKASILRFHTAVDVDYEGIYTVLKATDVSRAWLIRSGEGLSVTASPDDPKNVAAINDLLGTASPALTDDQVGAFSNLYFFIIGHGIRNVPFSEPVPEHPLQCYPIVFSKKGTRRIVLLSERGEHWRLIYSVRAGVLHLDSVVPDKGKE
jgi:hypothetical protein